jgi:choline dehydrogenase-like flavoprotein
MSTARRTTSGNLYVVDASFFPSSSAVNPGLTSIANALRVGDHRLERLRALPAASGETDGRFVRADTQTLLPHATTLSESTR